MSLLRLRGKVPPHDGGCWYCYHDDDIEGFDLLFCHEFDTYIHYECVKHNITENPDNPECQIICRELGISLIQSPESEFVQDYSVLNLSVMPNVFISHEKVKQPQETNFQMFETIDSKDFTPHETRKALQQLCICPQEVFGVNNSSIVWLRQEPIVHAELESLDHFYCTTCNSYWCEP